MLSSEMSYYSVFTTKFIVITMMVVLLINYLICDFCD